MLQQAQHLARRILQIVVHGDDMRAGCLAQPRHHRVVLAEIAREVDERDRHLGARLQPLAFEQARIRARVVDEDDLMAARHRERFERVHELAEAVGAVIDGDDDAQGVGHGFTAVAKIEPPKGKRKPPAANASSQRKMAPNSRSTSGGSRATSLLAPRWIRRCVTISGNSRLFQ
jgi:hypothetical protein